MTVSSMAAEGEQPTARLRRHMQAAGIGGLFVVAEDVEHRRAEHGVEGFPELGQSQRVRGEGTAR
ncbi:hypothetical protein ACFPOI_28910 [Nonomuraea angiospora]|uniref:Uncharacterized protein n=1 Tax=Nonomuraea angiospora TaxID=46172 RepID=A0ABR9LTU7_9ACTN|nr:hypothetical protein [Nonomuraea angiospora]MBE1584089.1 hypothetical protein [Nonomuraea angiospora]